MKRSILVFSVFGLLIFFVSSCFEAAPGTANTIKAPTLPSEMFDYEDIDVPVDLIFGNGPDILIDSDTTSFGGSFFLPQMHITNAGATLGRVLFYDKQLSLNNTIACGSCHFQSKGFADGLAKSAGFEGRITDRNSMAIVNPGLNNNLFWDSRVQSTIDLIAQPIQNHIEMGMEDLDFLSSKLAETEYYPDLFKSAYGSEEINPELISDAMSQFLNSMVSFNSKFDRESQNGFEGFTTLEKAGMQLFTSERLQCQGCHSFNNKMFSAPDGPNDEYGGGAPDNGGPDTRGTANIGLDVVYEDNGRFEGQFKIPTLRNITLTAPYMHDGRFETLMEVIDHYDSQVKPHQNLDDKFIVNGQTQKLNMTDVEKQALIAFLATLTDTDFVSDVKFSDPF